MSALDDAFAAYLLTIAQARPRPLKVVNTRSALEERAVLVEQVLQATAQYIDALMSDSGQHLNLSKSERELPGELIAEAASETRWNMVEAIRYVVHAA